MPCNINYEYTIPANITIQRQNIEVQHLELKVKELY